MIKNQLRLIEKGWRGNIITRKFSKLVNTEEYFDSEDVVDQLALSVTEKLLKAKHGIAFCGAGLSTKSGIPDYRSGYKTVLETGPGKWESDENKAKYEKTARIRKGNDAWPNDGHRALSALVREGFIKFVISQNVDGLLVRSGVPVDRISELHGNLFTEHCTCQQVYWRDFPIPNWATKQHFHGRVCECGKGEPLKDSLIYFGDSLNTNEIKRSVEEVHKADFCLVLGSSLQVNPAANFVRHALDHGKPGSLAVVNLQKTVFHGKGALEAHTFCDTFLLKVLDLLHIPLGQPVICRTLKIEPSRLHPDKLAFTFTDDQNHRVQAVQSITVHLPNQTSQKLSNPFEFDRDLLQKATSIDFEFIFLPGNNFNVQIRNGAIANTSDSGSVVFSFNYEHGGGLSFDKSTPVQPQLI